MDYIVSPSWFYWLHVLNGINTMSIVAIVVSLMPIVGFGIAMLMCESSILEFPTISDGERERLPHYKKIVKISIIVCVISIILAVFVPSRDVLIEMMVAKYVTIENIDLTVDAIKSAVDYIISAIASAA